MTKESIKDLEAKVFATNLREGTACKPKEKFNKDEFVKAAIDMQESTDKRDQDADTSSK